MSSKHVVFDVVGTCVSFSAFYSRIATILGSQLSSHNPPISAQNFGYTWMTAAELEFTFLSISSRHRPYKEVIKALFYRTLWMCGVSDPREFATDEERDACVQGYSELAIREGCQECFDILRSDGFTVWCLTTGDQERVKGYFDRGAIDMPVENIVSCDSRGEAKPALGAYRPILEKLKGLETGGDDGNTDLWFAAAHMWDVSAAVKVGFKGAYCSVYEKEPCLEIFDAEMEVVADTLPEMARGIVKAAGST